MEVIKKNALALKSPKVSGEACFQEPSISSSGLRDAFRVTLKSLIIEFAELRMAKLHLVIGWLSNPFRGICMFD